MESLKFTVPEILSLIGVTQCVYILVYMVFRAGNWKRVLLPALYFLLIGTAFFMDFAKGFIQEAVYDYEQLLWFLWFSGPPLSVLLIIQIAQVKSMPGIWDYWVLGLIPISYFAAKYIAGINEACLDVAPCPAFHEWLVITGLFAGAMSVTEIWIKRGLLSNLTSKSIDKERYWLIWMLIGINLLFLGVMLASLSPVLLPEQAVLLRTILGLGFVYLAGTSLFRIYPQTLNLISLEERRNKMSEDDQEIVVQIKGLMSRDKVYQEMSYSRADLARELNVSEAVISRVINVAFKKSFPQLLNEHRVDDAKRMLRETDAPIKVISEEVGFNSTASFYRAFRDIAGATPSDYRKEQSSS